MAHLLKDKQRKIRRHAYFRGRAAETLASTYLRCKGYHIEARGYRKPFGEIDIIARRNNLLVAVEVKSRRQMEAALYSVSARQRHRINKALEAFVMERPKFRAFSLRMDVLLVTSFLKLPRHIENAW
ncbi:MAG: YraN family protein [Sneathiella sp.]